MELHPSARRVADHAAERGLELAVREFPDGTRTAEDAAAAVGGSVDQIVKSMIFSALTDRTDDGGDDEGDAERDAERDDGGDGRAELVLALTSGAHKVDPEALARLAGVDRCGRADPEDVRAATGYAIGGVPPFGHRSTLRTWIDPHLLTFDEVWAAAGTPRHVFPISPTTLVELTGAEPADFT